jgi:hypothetical protein
LGAAVVYPLIWHFAATGTSPPSVAAAPHSAKPGSTARGALGPSAASQSSERRPEESEASERRAVSRTVTERLPSVPPTPEPVAGPELPHEPTADEPQVPLPAMPELKEALARVAEVQRHAEDPAELDRQVQTLDEDPAKLAKLKALADMFMKLPTPRSDDYLPSPSGAERHSTAR